MEATRQGSRKCLWSSLERLGLWEAYLERGAALASESGGEFGLRWSPSVDLLKVPDRAGVYVLFFQNKRFLVGESENVFRTLVQHYRSPGMSIHSFSWMACEHPIERKQLLIRWEGLGYDDLWAYKVRDDVAP